MRILQPLGLYVLVALFEIGGCFAFWAYLRLGRSHWLLVPGMLSLALFAWTLTRVDADFAGRAYAAYGGVYILTALFWLLAVERTVPDRWDIIGALVCVAGALIILLGPR